MAHRILMMAGDGVGEELLAAARLVLKATRVPLQIECMDACQRVLVFSPICHHMC